MLFNAVVDRHSCWIRKFIVLLTYFDVLQVQAVNVLFVDNPVGTGYSYVDDIKLLTNNVTEIANDLVSLFSAFLNTHQIFQVMKYRYDNFITI